MASRPFASVAVALESVAVALEVGAEQTELLPGPTEVGAHLHIDITALDSVFITVATTTHAFITYLFRMTGLYS